MTKRVKADSASPRLRGIERVGAALLAACATVLLIDSAVEAYTGPMNLAQSLLAWPGHIVAAFAIGAVSSLVPVTPAGSDVRVRVAALVALVGSVGWLTFTIGIVVLYAIVMSTFD